MAKDRWQELLQLVQHDDHLPTRAAGKWTEEKLWFWNRYIEITTSAMVGHPQWEAGLVYVDLFAGPGVCALKESGVRFPGSPLIAGNAPKPFKTIILVEKDESLADACATRMAQTPASSRFTLIRGDCNEVIDEVVSRIPDAALTLAFIDPEGLDAQFETIRTLTSGRRVDLLILFPDAYDILRNVDLYLRNPESKLDSTLGPGSEWRKRWHELSNQAGPNARELFAGIYKRQLQRELGYVAFGEQIIRSDKGPLYRLVYASKAERGLDFWHKISQRERGGQMTLFR